MLDEFFRTLVYRPRRSAETLATSSPSMDISKASNFERYVYDVVGRDAVVVRALWKELGERGEFDLAPYEARFARPALRPGAARTPIASRRSGTWTGATASRSIRTRPTA